MNKWQISMATMTSRIMWRLVILCMFPTFTYKSTIFVIFSSTFQVTLEGILPLWSILCPASSGTFAVGETALRPSIIINLSSIIRGKMTLENGMVVSLPDLDVWVGEKWYSWWLRPYHVEHTGSRPITEVKQRRAWLVLGWVTAWEYHVL